MNKPTNYKPGALLKLEQVSFFLPDAMLITDSQDLEPLEDRFDIGRVTGALVVTNDGDYHEVWVTGWSRPFDNTAIYEKVL